MSLLEEQEIDCPNCGELITVVIDLSIDEQEYIEDCSVCCSPIILKIEVLFFDLLFSTHEIIIFEKS